MVYVTSRFEKYYKGTGGHQHLKLTLKVQTVADGQTFY